MRAQIWEMSFGYAPHWLRKSRSVEYIRRLLRLWSKGSSFKPSNTSSYLFALLCKTSANLIQWICDLDGNHNILIRQIMPSTVVVQNVEKYGLGDPLMLEKIDKIFACGVGEHVYLPQIVVVGDQSSGKSSILEELIRMALPRDSGLCTRFATQIMFRRSIEERISVSIIPDRNATAEHQNQVEAWARSDVKSLDSDTFADIMRDVCCPVNVSEIG